MIDIAHECSPRHGNQQIVAALAVHFLTHAGLASGSAPVMPACKIKEGVLIRVGDKNNRSAVAPVTPIGATLRDVLLAPERDASVAAVAGFHVDDGFIDEHG